jgi:hypothetical protein
MPNAEGQRMNAKFIIRNGPRTPSLFPVIIARGVWLDSGAKNRSKSHLIHHFETFLLHVLHEPAMPLGRTRGLDANEPARPVSAPMVTGCYPSWGMGGVAGFGMWASGFVPIGCTWRRPMVRISWLSCNHLVQNRFSGWLFDRRSRSIGPNGQTCL